MQTNPTQVFVLEGYRAEEQVEQSSNFSAPLCSLTSGRLVFAAGAVGVTLYGDPLLPALYCAHFAGQAPNVNVQGGIITMHHTAISRPNRVGQFHEALATIALNGAIPWEIECRGGLAGLIAELRELPLRALDLGSVSGATLALPIPSATVFVYLAGSVSDVVFYRPHNVAARVQINGSASHLMFDEQYVGAVIDGVRWQSSDYQQATARYDISIAGSASQVTIATWGLESGE